MSNPDRTPVAQDVFTWCTREKTDTWHVVRNHNAQGIVERVVCKACGSEHKYRRAKAELPMKSSGSRVIVRGAGGAARPSSPSRGGTNSGISSSAAMEETWFAGIKKWGDKAPKPFDPGQRFDSGEVLDHAVFGKGVVQARRENRIDVLFKTGLKTLPSKA